MASFSCGQQVLVTKILDPAESFSGEVVSVDDHEILVRHALPSRTIFEFDKDGVGTTGVYMLT